MGHQKTFYTFRISPTLVEPMKPELCKMDGRRVLFLGDERYVDIEGVIIVEGGYYIPIFEFEVDIHGVVGCVETVGGVKCCDVKAFDVDTGELAGCIHQEDNEGEDNGSYNDTNVFYE